MTNQLYTQEPLIFPQGLVRLGTPRGSAPSSLAIISGECQSVLAGTTIGLFRSAGQPGSKDFMWARLASSPADILVVAVSPNFEDDGVLLVGTSNGIFCSGDGGFNWSPARLPRENLAVITIKFSPNFSSDGIVLAGTLGDGILYSDRHGKSWISRNFGLEDGAVFEVAFSPEFKCDTTLFAATDKAMYYSYNGALAWKQLDFPSKAPPILSLAISLAYRHSRTIYVGTEESGLFRSIDGGEHWSPAGVPASCINSLLATPVGLLAATDLGIFESLDFGDSWKCVLAESTVLNLCDVNGLSCASVSGRGVWMTDNLMAWHPLPDLVARAVVGIAVAPQAELADEVFMFGRTEGLWWSNDGGCAWVDIGGDLPSLGLSDLAISPCYANNRMVAAATSSGILISNDAGRHWIVSFSGCADSIVFSENGKYLAASIGVDRIIVSADLGDTWINVLVPWDSNVKVLSLAVSNTGQLYIACFISVLGILEIWQGISGHFKRVLSEQHYENYAVGLYIPVSPDRHWYASFGNRVFKFDPLLDNRSASTAVFDVGVQDENIICMVGFNSADGLVLLTNTGRNIYKSIDAMVWSIAYDFAGDRCIALTHSSKYSGDASIFVLMLGGLLCKGVLART